MDDFTIKLEEKRLLVEDYLTEQFPQETPYGILLEAMRTAFWQGASGSGQCFCLPSVRLAGAWRRGRFPRQRQWRWSIPIL